MRKLAILGIAAVCGISCGRALPSGDDFRPETLVALERGALDRWGKGDPQGYLDIMTPEETYFDPMTAKRIDGREALEKYFAPIAGKIKIEKVEMIDPKVQRSGDLAVLTFNLVDSGAQLGGGPKTTARWNSTEVYQCIDGSWKIVHSHWSLLQPVLKGGAAD
jgi:ketosteroid isomerase-like protein